MANQTFGLNRANHVGITVSDLDASIRFYETLSGEKAEQPDVLTGPRMAAAQGVDKVLIRYATVRLNNLNIDLLQYEEPKPGKAGYSNGDVAAMHLCFEVENLKGVYERMKAAGIKFTGVPLTFQEEDGLKHGQGTSVVYFSDPDGTHLELIEPKGPFQRVRP